MHCGYADKTETGFISLTRIESVLTVDNVEGEPSMRTLPTSAAAGSSPLRSTDNRQIQNNKRQTAGVLLCLLTCLCCYL